MTIHERFISIRYRGTPFHFHWQAWKFPIEELLNKNASVRMSLCFVISRLFCSQHTFWRSLETKLKGVISRWNSEVEQVILTSIDFPFAESLELKLGTRGILVPFLFMKPFKKITDWHANARAGSYLVHHIIIETCGTLTASWAPCHGDAALSI